MSTKNTLDILQEEVVIPEIVQEKANAAFDAIYREASASRRTSENEDGGKASEKKVVSVKTGRKHRRKMIATVIAAALAVCTVTAGAAVYMHWSSGLEEGLQVTEEQKQTAESTGLAAFPEKAVTNNGVTVTAQQSVADNYYAYLSFKIEGYTVDQGKQPGFNYINVQVSGEDATWGGSFYDGLITGADGKAVLADGSPVPLDENGSFLIDYVQEDGSMEYQINLSANGEKGAFLNKPIHVEMTDLGFYTEKAGDIQTEVEGTWAFDWTLEGDDSIYSAECSEKLGDTGATVIGAEISPISITAIYDFPRETVTETGYNEYYEEVDGEMRQVSEPFEYTSYKEPPVLAGVKLKDGTLLPYLYMGPGASGYADEQSNKYISRFAVDRILNVDEVQSLLFRKSWPEEGSVPTEENFYVVDIR